MGKRFFVCAFALAIFAASYGQSAPVQVGASSSLAFSENKGQWDERVQFLAKTNGLNLWLTDEGLVLDYHKFVPNANEKRDPNNRNWQPKGTVLGDVVRMTLVNAQPSAVSGVGKLAGEENYFIGNKPSRWASSVTRFSEARMEQPYPGIAVRYYFDQGAPRYDIIANPGADVKQVGFKIEGVRGMQILPSGNLELETPYGSIIEKGLLAYQESGTTRNEIPCRMVVDEGVLRFNVGAYDSTKPLIIDPLVFSTYIGGTGGDAITCIKIDSTGNVVVAGNTYSTDFPTTTGAYQKTNAGYDNGTANLFISKFNPTGTTLLTSTYLGGSGIVGTGEGDNVTGLALDSSNNTFLTGVTYSADFPTTVGALQTTNPEYGYTACFVSKVSADGTKLLSSTYLGGSGASLEPPAGTGDVANGIAVDSSGDAIVVGTAQNSDFPIYSGAYQKTFGGICAPFVCKLNPTLATIIGGTYLSGSLRDFGQVVAIDSTQNIAIAGYATSSDFPTTTGAYQKTNPNNAQLGFVAKVSASGSTLLASTYFGGTSVPTTLALDASASYVIGGTTYSPGFPLTTGAFQTTYGETDSTAGVGFVAKISADATKLMASTFLGGSGNGAFGDSVLGLALDASGNPVLAGTTDTNNFPLTPGAFQTSNKGFASSFTTGFVSKLTADCTQLLSSTYLGGSGGDNANCVALDSSGNPIVAGGTGSTNFPTTTGAYKVAAPGSGDGFITDLAFSALALELTPASIAGGLNTAGKVLLPIVAVGTGTTVTLTSSNPAIASVPASVTVAAGSIWTTFPITTTPVSAVSAVTITAKVGTYSQASTLTVILPSLASAAFAPTSVVGGNAGSCTVTLGSPAGPSGVVVTTSGAGPWTLPASVTVPAGKTSATFSVATAGVNASTVSTLSAKFGAVTKTATFTIAPAALATFTATYPSIVGGLVDIGTLGLNGKGGPLGDTVTFSSTGPVVAPAPVNLISGTTSVTIRIPTQAVSVATTATVTATMGTISKAVTFTVIPAQISGVSLPAAVLGGGSATCTVSLSNIAGPSGDVVALTGTGPWTLPASVTVPAGKTALSFSVPTKAVSAATVASVTAKLGTSSGSASTSVSEASVSYMLFLPTSVVGGTTAFGIVTLNGPAGPSGDVVKLSGVGPWTLPASVTVPAGQTGAFFLLTTKSVTVSTTANITATLGASVVAALTVTP